MEEVMIDSYDCCNPRVTATSSAATVTILAAVSRFSLRAGTSEIGAIGRKIGTNLPRRVGARSCGSTIEILCLGPDEWQVSVAEVLAPRLIAACANVYQKAPHSLTDISARDISILVQGPLAAELLAIGCPRDLRRLSDGEGCRTLMDGVTIILHRDGSQRFRLDAWRSFAPHVLALLKAGCAELAAEQSAI